jgi:cyclopropane-fatty-acyl-phospholipid synthase
VTLTCDHGPIDEDDERYGVTAADGLSRPQVGGPGAGRSTEGASQQAIEHHYDVGREFYDLWLDPRRVYSCGYWPGALDDDLDSAQVAKLAWHATGAGADGASRVLDVGCGWGALLGYLTAERGVAHVTGLTLSTDQAEAAQAVAGPRAEVRLEDWCDHEPAAPYDAIISIGAFEHFARPNLDDAARRGVYGAFFDRCGAWLPAGGRLSLQTIAWEDPQPEKAKVSTFFTEEIFPESFLPTLSDIVIAAQPTFRVRTLRSDADHYERTLQLWQRRLQANEAAALALVDRAVYRRYLRYLRVSRAMFERGVCTLYRLVLERRPGTGGSR